MSRGSRTGLIALGVVGVLIAGGALWVRHEYLEFEASIEEWRAERIADAIELARQSGDLHISYTSVSDEEWRTIGEIGLLKSVSLYEPDAGISGRPMLEYVETRSLSLKGCWVAVVGIDQCPPNESVRSLDLYDVTFDRDAAAFLAALPRLETLSIVRTTFGHDRSDYPAIEEGLTNVTGLQRIGVDDADLGERLRERFPDVEVVVRLLRDDEVY